MKKNKQRQNSIFFNEDKTLEAIYLRAQKDGLPFKTQKRENFMNKTWLKGLATILVAASAVLVFTFLNSPSDEGIIDVIQEKTVIAYVSIDINPSFEISVYDDNTVESIASLNDDALTIDVSDLIGMDVDLAIEAIVSRATEAGFIDTTDIIDDYVLVTTVVNEECTSDCEEALELKIQDRIQTSETLNSVYVVELKSDMQTKFEADEKNVPVGLYVINGEILQEDGTYLSVKEVFSNEDKLTELTHTYQINISDISADQLTIKIQSMIDELALQDIDVSAYEATLVEADIDTLHALHDQILDEYGDLLSNYQSPNPNPGTPSDNAAQDPQKPDNAGDGDPIGEAPENGAQTPKENTGSPQSGKNN